MKAILILALTTALTIQAQQMSSPVAVFSNGEGTHPSYRIPALTVAQDGALLAFIEGRQTMHDHAHNDLVVRRSTDNGKTWGEHQVIYANEHVLVNPSPVVLDNGEILVFIEEFPDKFHARAGKEFELLKEGFGPGSQKLMLFRSKDNGKSWSGPENLTKDARDPKILTAGSPAASIQLKNGQHKGRILVPLYGTTWNENRRYNYLSVLFSDDNGKTWKRGDHAPNPLPLEEVKDKAGSCNEFHIAELEDGTVVINARGNLRGRYYSRSSNGGKSWSKLELIQPSRRNNNAMMSCSTDEGETTLVQSFSASTKKRANGIIQISTDGKEWKQVLEVNSETVPFGYSALAQMKNGNIGLLYEEFAKSKKCIQFIEINSCILKTK